VPYIHELRQWPKLTWDSAALTGTLAQVRHRQGRHLGRMEALGFGLRAEAGLTTLTEDAVTSAAIEGEKLDPREVRSSVARRLGLDIAGLPRPRRQVEGVVEMMLDATQNYPAALTAQRLFDWHAALFPTGRSGMQPLTIGAWRTPEGGPMRVVSGAVGRERVHFRAPEAEAIEKEMRAFLQWFNAPPQVDVVLRAGVAHLWFLTIHPFDDGNGRIARALTDLGLARADGMKERFYSMSAAIASERAAYYNQLESAQRGGLDITAWLLWFLGCLERAIDRAEGLLESVLRKARLWQRINMRPVNDRQRKVINRMLDGFQGHLTTSKYAALTKCSTDTALRDVRELLNRGVLLKNPGGGRGTSYRLGEAADVLA